MPVSEIIYDAASRPIAYQGQFCYRTTQGYNARGQWVTAMDARGYVSMSAYDAAGRKVAKQNALGHRATYTCDAAGKTQTRQFPSCDVTDLPNVDDSTSL
ncbi:MAG: hypothetical protein JNM28_02930 [Armatimonadetes bacterium]|nr:hypothetical protein [Armatimonadota bacterium]